MCCNANFVLCSLILCSWPLLSMCCTIVMEEVIGPTCWALHFDNTNIVTTPSPQSSNLPTNFVLPRDLKFCLLHHIHFIWVSERKCPFSLLNLLTSQINLFICLTVVLLTFYVTSVSRSHEILIVIVLSIFIFSPCSSIIRFH